MRISENEIEALVRGVLNNLQNGGANNGGSASANTSNAACGDSELRGLHGIFDSPDEAVRAAQAAQQQWVSLPLPKRKECVQAMRDAGVWNARKLAEMAVEETGLGRVDDKEVKNQLASEKSPGWEMLPLTTFYGEDGLTIEDYFPFGVLCGILPVTQIRLPASSTTRLFSRSAATAACFARILRPKNPQW